MYTVNGYSHHAQIARLEAEVSSLQKQVEEYRLLGSSLLGLLTAHGLELPEVADLVIAFEGPKQKEDPREIQKGLVLEAILRWSAEHHHDSHLQRAEFAAAVVALYPLSGFSKEMVLSSLARIRR